MVYYSFDKKINSRDPIDLKSRIRQEVTYWKLIRLFITDVIQLCYIFFVQYKLFHRGTENEICYYSTLVISLLSGVITMIFSIRIDKMNVNKHPKIMQITVCTVLVINFIYSWFVPPIIFYSELWTEIITSVFLLLQFPNCFRQTLVIFCAIKCKFSKKEEDKIRFYIEMVDAQVDSSFIGIVECYLKGAPLLTLQIAVPFYKHDDFTQISWREQLSIAAALGVVLPWTATSYHNLLRKQMNDFLPWTTVIVFFIWNTFVVSARIIGISAVLAFWPAYTLIAILVQWLVTTLLLCYTLKPIDFYNKNKICHFMFCSVFGMIYIFNYINMSQKRKFWHYVSFYAIVFVQTTISLLLWCTNESTKTVIYKASFVAMTEVLFICGIVLMILYYSKLHPRKQKNKCGDNYESEDSIPLQVFNVNLSTCDAEISPA